jgi:hypothetical protein
VTLLPPFFPLLSRADGKKVFVRKPRERRVLGVFVSLFSFFTPYLCLSHDGDQPVRETRPGKKERRQRSHKEQVRQLENSAAGYWARRQRGSIELPEAPDVRAMRFDLRLDSLTSERSVRVPLVGCVVPPGITIPEGTYALCVLDLENDLEMLPRRIHVAGEESVDLAQLPDLGDVQMASLTAQRAVEPVAPRAPSLHRIPRMPHDSGVSRLGFTIGDASQEIRLVSAWFWHALYLPRPLMVGAIEAPITLLDKDSFVTFHAYDFAGNKILDADLKKRSNGTVRAEFDHVRLKAGDVLVAWHARAGFGSSAQGSYPTDSGIFGRDLPERPLLDALVSRARSGVDEMEMSIMSSWNGAPRKIGMPQFRFAAD